MDKALARCATCSRAYRLGYSDGEGAIRTGRITRRQRFAEPKCGFCGRWMLVGEARTTDAGRTYHVDCAERLATIRGRNYA